MGLGRSWQVNQGIIELGRSWQVWSGWEGPGRSGWVGKVLAGPLTLPLPSEGDEKAKLQSDAMFRLEHNVADRAVLQRAVPTLANLQEAQSAWKDDFGLNSLLRRRFRVGDPPRTPPHLLRPTLEPSSLPGAPQAPPDPPALCQTLLPSPKRASYPSGPPRDPPRTPP